MRRPKLPAGFMLATYLSFASLAKAQPGSLPDELREKIETAVAAFMTDSKVPGISVAVVRGGEFVWSAGFGMADLENSVPATSQTVYRLGSISKPLTAAAAMALWQEGKLDLNSPVQKYCPAFPQKPSPITTRQLLGHLAGVRSYKVPEYPYWDSEADPEVGNTLHFENGIEGGLKFFASEPLIAKPGTHFNYSTQGYTVVGCAIEGASAKKYADYVRERILVPAGMSQTRPDDRFAVIPLRTRFYSKDRSGAVVNAEFLDSSYKVPGGGWLSSAPDMARFAVSILKDRLVNSATREMMWTQQMPADGLGRMAYGLGWQMGSSGGVKVVGHGGSQQGTSAAFLIAPDSRAAVIVLTNSDGNGAAGLATKLLRITVGVPLEHRTIPGDPAVWEKYVGTYRLTDFVLTTIREGERFFLETSGRKIQLFPESERDFAIGTGDSEISFVTDDTGRAAELVLHEGGADSHLRRVK